MRLTLRTLLAWLDDTLPPGEVKAISRQLDESPFAKDLVSRISRVTRQRRLLVPPSSGPDAVDPNLVASYLDNELNPELVAEYERICLTSSVNLAEAASVHQILSLIGQKAKVPPDARFRMYRLIKGRETSAPAKPAPRSRKSAAAPQPTPVTQPIPTWGPEAPPQRNWLETYAPAGVVLALVAILGVTAYSSLSGERPRPANDIALASPTPIPAAPPTKNAAEETKPAEAPPAPMPTPTPEVAGEPTEPVASKPDVAPPKPGPARFPAGSVAVVEAVDGALLVENLEAHSWDPVKAGTNLKENAHVLNLSSFRNTLKANQADVTLVDRTDAILRRTEEADGARLDLIQGRLLVQGKPEHQAVAIKAGTAVAEIHPRAGSLIGVERMRGGATLIVVSEGEASIKVGVDERSATGPSAWSLSVDGKLTDVSDPKVPTWLTADKPLPASGETAQAFARYFREGRPALASLVEALDDPADEVRLKAIESLAALGDIELIVSVLNRPKDPAIRRAVASVLHDYLVGATPEAEKSVRTALDGELGDPWGPIAEKLIVGYNRDDLMNEMLASKLVSYLKDAPFVSVRELALANLMRLTGRGPLDYDPENPVGKGLKAWEDLLSRGDLLKDGRDPR